MGSYENRNEIRIDEYCKYFDKMKDFSPYKEKHKLNITSMYFWTLKQVQMGSVKYESLLQTMVETTGFGSLNDIEKVKKNNSKQFEFIIGDDNNPEVCIKNSKAMHATLYTLEGIVDNL